MTLGEKIQSFRKQNALSQERLAEMVGVSRQAVTKWEMNQSVPSMKNLLKLAEIFQISINQLTSTVVNVEVDSQDPKKKDDTILIANLTILATIFIGGAGSGIFQNIYIKNSTPIFLWIIAALTGGIIMMIRDRYYYKLYKKQLIIYDFLFVIPIFVFSITPIPRSISILFIMIYSVTFTIIFIHKKIRPWK